MSERHVNVQAKHACSNNKKNSTLKIIIEKENKALAEVISNVLLFMCSCNNCSSLVVVCASGLMAYFISW